MTTIPIERDRRVPTKDLPFDYLTQEALDCMIEVLQEAHRKDTEHRQACFAATDAVLGINDTAKWSPRGRHAVTKVDLEQTEERGAILLLCESWYLRQIDKAFPESFGTGPTAGIRRNLHSYARYVMEDNLLAIARAVLVAQGVSWPQ